MASFIEKRREKFGQLLMEAVGRGDVNELEELLKNRRYDLDYSRRVKPVEEEHEKDHHTLEEEIGYYLEENALEYATRKGNIDMMKYLKDKGLTFNKRNMQLLEHSTYEKDAEVLRFLFNNQMIGSRDAANRAIRIVFRKIERGGEIPPNDNIILQLIKSPSFSLKDVDCVEFLKAAFMAGVADEVLKRGDLVLDEDGKEELLQVAVEHGSPSEIQMLIDRADIDLKEVNYTDAQSALIGDHANLIDSLMFKTTNDPQYNNAILGLLNNESISLEHNGLYLLSKALDLGDTRIFEMLANRADVFMNVIKFGDDELAMKLLSRDELKLHPDVLVAAAQNEDISPETIHAILSHDNFEASEDIIAKSANLAGKAGRFDAVHEIVEHYHNEDHQLETVNSGELLNTCVNAAVKEMNILKEQQEKEAVTQKEETKEQENHVEHEIREMPEESERKHQPRPETSERIDMAIMKFRGMVRDLYERPGYNPNRDKFFDSTAREASIDHETFAFMMHREGLNMRRYGFTFLSSAFERGYEDNILELLERDDLVIGARFDEILSQVDDRFKEADNIRQRLTERHRQEQRELEERQYSQPGHEMSI